jgi:hypothetical protein
MAKGMVNRTGNYLIRVVLQAKLALFETGRKLIRTAIWERALKLKVESNPPDAVSLMMSARSFGNYDLAGALADLIDNSIKAKARNIWISCLFNEGDPAVSIVDDGCGMSLGELRQAMRPASTNPTEERSPDDLGRFGWGMKSASFSQCRKLTVLSRQDSNSAGAVWDLDAIDNWSMGILSDEEIAVLASERLGSEHGTEIHWEKCDRLSENGAMTSDAFNRLVAQTSDDLALVFHRFLDGKADRPRLTIGLNGRELSPFDPFHSSHKATQPLELEYLPLGEGFITVRPYILPHFSKLKETEHERLGGEEGFLRNQGFYVYRNHRLIIHGTWFRLAKYGELSQLIRISVDIPNSMDDVWKITVDKSDAQLPALLRNRLKQIVDGLKGKSAKVYRGKGGKIDNPGTVAIWSRYTKNNEIRYTINKDHPVIAHLLAGSDAETATAVLRLIEQNFPVSAFADDAALKVSNIAQSVSSREEMKHLLDVTAPRMLSEANGDMAELIGRLKSAEPFGANWPMVEEYLTMKGWIK